MNRLKMLRGRRYLVIYQYKGQEPKVYVEYGQNTADILRRIPDLARGTGMEPLLYSSHLKITIKRDTQKNSAELATLIKKPIH